MPAVEQLDVDFVTVIEMGDREVREAVGLPADVHELLTWLCPCPGVGGVEGLERGRQLGRNVGRTLVIVAFDPDLLGELETQVLVTELDLGIEAPLG